MGTLTVKDHDAGRQVHWRTSPGSNTYRNAPLIRKKYGRRAGVYVEWAGKSTFIPNHLIVDGPRGE